jgi:hypothetical protein
MALHVENKDGRFHSILIYTSQTMNMANIQQKKTMAVRLSMELIYWHYHLALTKAWNATS